MKRSGFGTTGRYPYLQWDEQASDQRNERNDRVPGFKDRPILVLVVRTLY